MRFVRDVRGEREGELVDPVNVITRGPVTRTDLDEWRTLDRALGRGEGTPRSEVAS
jgi:hypothetical protein